jgi:hypothetical protein
MGAKKKNVGVRTTANENKVKLLDIFQLGNARIRIYM